MNIFKKRLALVLATTMVLLTGCGGSTSSNGDGDASGSATPTLDRIKAADVLNVGVKADVPNFGLMNTTTNEIEGYEIDIAKRIVFSLLGDETKINMQPVTAKARGPLLDTGELDLVIATFTITDERKEAYNFSEPYYTDAVRMMVKKDAGIASLADMDGKMVGVAMSATSRTSLEAAAKELNITLQFDEYPTYPELKAALDSGRIDCFSVDGSILSGYLDDSTIILDDAFTPQGYGVCSKLDNTDLSDFVNDVLAEMEANGELAELRTKWNLDN